MMNELSRGMRPPPGMFEQDCEVPRSVEGMMMSYGPMRTKEYFGPWKRQIMEAAATGATITSDKNKFEIILDLHYYRPEEITAKTADRYLIIEGKQEEKEDGLGVVSRQFTRRYAIPDSCDPDQVLANITPDGLLTIRIPKVAPTFKNERIIHISRNGFPKKSEKSDESETEGDEPQED